MSARATTAVVLVILGVAAVAITGGALWAIVSATAERPEAAVTITVTYGVIALLALAGIVAAAWAFVHLRLVRPIAALTKGAEILARLDSEGAIELPHLHALGALVDAVGELGRKLREAPGEARS